MADQTGIQWCDATFNPWVGCEQVSPGCAHCYAETLVTGRMGRAGTWGSNGVRQRTSEANWRKPLRWARLARDGRLPNGEPNSDGHRPRVFCASLADVFEERDELDDWRRDLFDLIEQTPELDWLLLTKRPEHAREVLRLGGDIYWGDARVLPNVWLGVSIEDARHTWRADVLRQIPAAVRFISAEPLLGSLYPKGDDDAHLGREDRVGNVLVPGTRDQGLLDEGEATAVRLGVADGRERDPGDHHVAALRLDLDPDLRHRQHRAPLDLTGIDWIIAGAESGHGARPMDEQWVREIRDACLTWGSEHGTPETRPAFFYKQNAVNGRKIGLPELDGRQWTEFPRA